MAVLVIGSMGHGKSSLGNYLLDPDFEGRGRDCYYFGVSTDNKSETQQTKAETGQVQYQEIDDEPENVPNPTAPPQDLETAIDILQEAKTEAGYTSQQKEEITPKQEIAPQQMEADYQKQEHETTSQQRVQGAAHEGELSPSEGDFGNRRGRLSAAWSFFRKRFPIKKVDEIETHTETKLLTVIDTPGLNEGEEKDLQHSIDLVKTLHDIGTVLACIFVVKFDATIDSQYKNTIEYYSMLLPSLFSKNCIVVLSSYKTDPLTEEERKRRGVDYEKIKENVKKEIMKYFDTNFMPVVFPLDCYPSTYFQDSVAESLEVRSAILSKIFSHRPLDVKNIKVAKPTFMLQKHEERKASYTMEVENYSRILMETNQRKASIVKAVHEKEGEITEIERKLGELKEELEEKNTDDIITAKEWAIEKEFLWFKWHTEKIDVMSDCEIINVKKWTNGHCSLVYEVSDDKKRVTGTLHGYFMRGLYASITLEAIKKIMFASDITQLCENIAEKERKCLYIRHQADKEIETVDETIKLLQTFHDEKRELIKKLSVHFMTVEEAESELKELQKRIQH